jgi:hypothetical protein
MSAHRALLRRRTEAVTERATNFTNLGQRLGCESSRPHGADSEGDHQRCDDEDDSDRKEPLRGAALWEERLRGLGLGDQQPRHRESLSRRGEEPNSNRHLARIDPLLANRVDEGAG